MLKKAFANLLVRKSLIFTGVLAITLVIMGGNLANQYDQNEARGKMVHASSLVNQETPELHTTPATVGSVWDYIVPVAYADEPDSGSIRLADWRPAESKRDEEAGSHDGDRPDGKTAKLEEQSIAMASSDGADVSGFVYSDKIPLSRELQEYTYEQCQENGLDYELVLAVMWRESRFQTSAVNINRNGTQDSGIMQINDVNKTWLSKELGITDLMDPKQNIAAGTAMLGRFTAKYGEHNALLAYQYGEAGMQRKLKQGVTTNKQVQMLYAKRDDFVALLA
ncbi:transglycosylase SLT domain-containing protein [Ruminococcaceae bacterium OttesenSCG-928-L11]|nr:transglycosylase SLT domain-containing protein [Ruminococcaceae bacterium OttesenSCG-928-L11]